MLTALVGHMERDVTLDCFSVYLGAVHHWDEWGLENIVDEPPAIQKIHGEMVAFVEAWLEDWEAPVRQTS